MNNVTPIVPGIPILNPPSPKATDEQIAKYRPTSDWLLVRSDAALRLGETGIIIPGDAHTALGLLSGTVLAAGPNAGDYFTDLAVTDENGVFQQNVVGQRVRWAANAQPEVVKVGEEPLLTLRARMVVAVLAQ